MELVYSRFGENVIVCVDCQTGLTIPRRAWDIAEVKKQQQIDRLARKLVDSAESAILNPKSAI